MRYFNEITADIVGNSASISEEYMKVIFRYLHFLNCIYERVYSICKLLFNIGGHQNLFKIVAKVTKSKFVFGYLVCHKFTGLLYSHLISLAGWPLVLDSKIFVSIRYVWNLNIAEDLFYSATYCISGPGV